MSDLSLKALEYAKTQVGQKENPAGSNWGHPVQDFLANVNIFSPASWCMAFMYSCFKEAAKQLNVANPLFKTGGCILQMNMSKPHIVKEPQPGDIFILDLGHGHGHTGIVESVLLLSGTVTTIEGNSNNNGSADGEAVVNHTRQISKVKAFLRF